MTSIDFDQFRRVGITPTDLARVLRMGRVTVSLWFNGHAVPQPRTMPAVKDALDRVRAAYIVGDLPVPYDVTRRERGLYLARVLRLNETDYGPPATS